MKTVKTYKKKSNPSLDKLTYVIGFSVPIFTLPQAYNVVVGRVNGVSLSTWGFYLFASMLFAYFGIKHKEKLLTYMYVPMAMIEAVIVVGIVLRYTK